MYDLEGLKPSAAAPFLACKRKNPGPLPSSWACSKTDFNGGCIWWVSDRVGGPYVCVLTAHQTFPTLHSLPFCYRSST